MKPLKLFLLALGAIAPPVFAQTFQSSNLPIVVINTKGAVILDEPKVAVELGIVDNGPGKRNAFTDPWNGYRGAAGIEIRGASSQMFPKKPYGFETRDAAGEDKAVSLLGFPAEADWVLNASYNDKTLIRDPLAYWLARQQGRYASRTKYVEVLKDSLYQGVYILQERIKRDKARVDISKLEPKDNSGDALTGGYILKIDKTSGSPAKRWNSLFKPDPRSTFSPLFQVEYPKLEDITNEQFAYIKTYVDAFETAIYGPDYRDVDKGFRKFIDEDSFVDYFLLTELTRNVDGYRLSAFFSKNRDSKGGKLTMGPAWDYNIAFGNGDYYDGWKPEGWQYRVNDGMLPLKVGQQYEDGFKAPAWWERLLSDPAFARKATQRWKTLRADAWSDTRLNRFVDSCATLLGESQSRNFERWKILGTYVWPNYYVGKTYAEEVTWMKNWLRQRLAWLDERVNAGYLVTGTEPDLTPTSLEVWPNPTERGSQIRYQVLQRGPVRLSVYDLTGRRVQTLAEDEREAGQHELDWGTNGLAPGLYLLELQAEGQAAVRRKVLKW